MTATVTYNRIHTRWTAMLVAATACAISLAIATPARADQYDFVMALDNRGVYYSSVSDVIDVGKMACRMMRGALGVRGAVNYVARSGFVKLEVGIVVYAAAANMCPDVMLAINAYVNGNRGGADA
ncbi:DUF732 domain-containing protein [Mycobacteroides abscessus]|uniref:DUF732 domain-containing protein n=1 Tax=Mycobacteroides abscessus TaxID=36809 RepID=UPI0018967FC1